MNFYLMEDILNIEEYKKEVERNFTTLFSPDWGNPSMCHDWKNYIDKDIRLIWQMLSGEERYMAFLTAEKRADAEEWD